MINKLMLTSACVALLVMSGAASADQVLAQKNACMSCHGVDKRIVGPAFMLVAKKYAGDKEAHDRLVAKLKTGGSGVWSKAWCPQSPQVRPEDASKIIDWVLSLK